MTKNNGNGFTVFIERYYYLFLAAVLIMALFNIFYSLGSTPINSWDEARHGVSAFEMLKTGNPVVNTYAYEIDYWNLKPPLSFWLISLGYKIAGFNPLGLRIFSAAAAFITIAVTAFFSFYHFGKLASLISASVLTATTQYIMSHCARTGDADSIHVLLFTLSVVFVSFSSKNIKWLYFSGLFFSLAFLNKSWHALSIPIIIGLYLITNKMIFKIRAKEWLVLSAFSLTPVLIWGGLRYAYDGTAFLEKMITFDLLSRSAVPLEGHSGTSSYYLITLEYGYWYWLLILAGSLVLYLAVVHASPSRNSVNLTILLLLWAFTPLLIYSYAQTKITWYILPIFPVLSICIGALTSRIIKSTGRNVLLHLAIAFVLFFSLYKNEATIMKDILNIKQDEIQSDLRNTSMLKGFEGTKIYTLCGGAEYPVCWRQSDLLVAELYGNLKPRDGGLYPFINEKSNSLIIVPKNDMYSYIINHIGLKVLLEGRSSYILY